MTKQLQNVFLLIWKEEGKEIEIYSKLSTLNDEHYIAPIHSLRNWLSRTKPPYNGVFKYEDDKCTIIKLPVKR